MEKKTLNHHFMVIKSLLKIAIDLERRFCTNQGQKRQNRAPEPTEGQQGNAQQAAPRAPPWYCRGNAAMRARRARRFGPGFVPWPPVLQRPIYTPLGFPTGADQVLGVVFLSCCSFRVV